MLAAGRKRQFRQKKDKDSGSHGKSTKKSGKSEQHEADADAVSTATKPTALSQVHEGETESPEGSNSEIVNTSVSNSAESDTSVAVVGPSAVPITHEKNVVEIELEKSTESPSEEVGVSKPDVYTSIQNEGERTGTADAEMARDISLDTSHIVDRGGEAENSNMSIQDDVSAQHASVDITEGMSVTIQSEIPRREKVSLPLRDNINTALMQEREDQVTDVGAMQEADGLDTRQSNPSREAEVELEGGIRPSVSELERSVEPFSGPASYADEQIDVVDEASALAGATMSDGPLVFASDAKSSFPSCEAEVVLEGDNKLGSGSRAEMLSNLASSIDKPNWED